MFQIRPHNITFDKPINIGIFMLNDTDEGLWEHNFITTNFSNLALIYDKFLTIDFS